MRLFGKNPVIERVKKDPKSIKRIVLQKGIDLSDLVKALKEKDLSFESVEKEWFKKNLSRVHTQGVFAEVDDFEYYPFAAILKDCLAERSIPVFLDGLTDPQNLGGIIRTLACMGGYSIVLPEHRSAEVNETVLRVASGGENYLQIAQVTNIATTLSRMQEKGVRVLGATSQGGESPKDVDLSGPLAAVIGSEGKGIRPGVEKLLDVRVSIPMEGANLSYNAAIATALFCYEIKFK